MSDIPIKALFLDSSTTWTGGCEWSLKTATGLLDRSIEVTIGCAPGSKLEQRARASQIQTWTLNHRGLSFPIASLQLSKHLSLNQIDVVVVNRRADLQTAALACALSGKKLVQRFGYAQPLPRGLVHRWIYGSYVSVLVGNCSAIVDRLREDSGYIPKTKFRMIYNGVEMPVLSESTRAAARDKLDLEEGEFAVGMLGPLTFMKGLHNLMGAWRLVAEQCPAARLMIAGTGEMESQVANDVQRLGLSDSVRLLGFQEDPSTFLKALDLFVLPSIQDEGCNHGVLEAMAHGLPIIVTNCGGLPELIESGRSGRVAPKNHADSFAETIVDTIGNPQLRSSMAERARSTVAAEFSLQKSIEAWEQLIRELAPPPGSEGNLVPITS